MTLANASRLIKNESSLTHWGRVTHICVSDLTSIGSDNGLSPGRCQAIIRTNAGILLIRPLRTNSSEFLVEILIFSFKKMRLKVSSAKRRPFCIGLNELIPVFICHPLVAKPLPVSKYTTYIFQTNTTENVVCKIATILCRSQCCWAPRIAPRRGYHVYGPIPYELIIFLMPTLSSLLPTDSSCRFDNRRCHQ